MVPRTRRLVSLALAGGGVLFVHQVSYALAGGHISHGMEATGVAHAYLRAVSDLILAVSLVGVAAVFMGDELRSDRSRWGRLAGLILTFQVGTFVAMEIVERLFVGATMGDLRVVLPIGLALQVPVALAIILALAWLHDVGRRLAATRSPGVLQPVRAAQGWLQLALAGEPAAVPATGSPSRGPPNGR